MLLGTGAKIWLWICVIANAFAALSLLIFFNNIFKIPGISFAGWLMSLIFSIIGCVCYIIIVIEEKKVPFYIIVICSGIAIIINFIIGTGIFSLTGVINPLITFLVLRKNLPYMD